MSKVTAAKKKGSDYQKTVLPNGLRVLSERIPSVRSISLGVWVDVGGRNEAESENGISHLIEHMVFKGTTSRSSKQIASSLESIGGHLNAFTSREQTCFTARILDEHLETAIDVLADITCRASMTPGNLKKEKMVVCEEIREADDTPSDRIHDLFAGTFWGGHPLGRPILGPAKNVNGFQRRNLKDYIARNYRAGSIIISAAGNVSHKKLVALCKKYFEFAEGERPAPVEAVRTVDKRINVVTTEHSQVQLSLGFPGYGFGAKEKLPLLVLNGYLGGGMSSVLFQKVREEKGLAYSVFTYHDSYYDGGLFGIYLGTDPKQARQAVEIVLREVKKVCNRKITDVKLQTVKDQLKGQFMLGLEATSARMSRMARQELYLGKFVTMTQTLKQIDAVTSSDILEAVNRVADPSEIALAALGPVEESALNGLI